MDEEEQGVSKCHKGSLCSDILIPRRHTLDLFTQPPPIIRHQLGILDSLLAPILMQPTNMIHALIEEPQFISDTLFDKHAAGVLLNNGFLVLQFD
jgi:hypothetical protein